MDAVATVSVVIMMRAALVSFMPMVVTVMKMIMNIKMIIMLLCPPPSPPRLLANTRCWAGTGLGRVLGCN